MYSTIHKFILYIYKKIDVPTALNNSEYINNCFKLNKNTQKGIAKIVNKDNYKYIIDIQMPTKPNGDFKNLTKEEVLQIIDNLDVEKIIYDIYN